MRPLWPLVVPRRKRTAGLLPASQPIRSHAVHDGDLRQGLVVSSALLLCFGERRAARFFGGSEARFGGGCARVLLFHLRLVETFHALRGECVFFEDWREVVDCVGVEAHREAEKAGLGDDGVEAWDDGFESGAVGVQAENGFEVRVYRSDDEVDMVCEVWRKGTSFSLVGFEHGAQVCCVVRVAVETWM